MKSGAVGTMGEHAACQFLVKRGYEIIERNYRKPWGEIDIVARKGEVVRFVEVKTISREMYPVADRLVSREMDHNPEDLVDTRKLAKIAKTASLYMEQHRDNREYQIDVVGVFLDYKRRVARCRLLEQAL